MPAGFFPSYSVPVEYIPTASFISLPSGSGVVSSVFDNSLIQAADARIFIASQAASTPLVGGTLDVYMFSGIDTSTNLTDNVSPTVTAGTSLSTFIHSRHIVSIPGSPSSSAIYWESSLLDYVGSLPRVWGIGVVNNLGVALSSSSSVHKFWLSFVNYGYA